VAAAVVVDRSAALLSGLSEERESATDGNGRPVLARFAGMSDADAIRRICAESHRTTYAGLLDRNEIEHIIDEYDRPERIRSELAVALPHWGGWVVAEDRCGALVAAGGGGLTAGNRRGSLRPLGRSAAPPAGRKQRRARVVSDQQRQAGASTREVAVLDTNKIGLAFYAR
jgi:hypothetical protein